MSFYILSNPRLTRSSKPLAKKIQELTKKEILVITDQPQGRNHECIIRYGTSAPIYNFNKDTIYNSPEHIRFAGNKLRLSELLTEKEFGHIELSMQKIPERFPVVVRTELNRGGGIGIVICENQQEWNKHRGFAWSYWYDFQFELGVHILGGEIVRVFKKVRSEDLEEEKYPIRNTQRGYEFKLRTTWRERYTGLEKWVKKLYEIVPIQFARLDVGFNKETGGYRLIEINSAPDLSQNENTLNLYAEFLAGKVFK